MYKITLIGTIVLFLLTGIQLSAENTTSIKVQESHGIKYFTLQNGFTVYLNEDHNQSEVFGLVVTRAGGKNDPKDATGMAHYMEHMLFKGTTEIGTIDWEKEKVHIDEIFNLYDKLGQTKDEEQRKTIQKQINNASLEANKYAIPNEFSNILKGIGATNLNAGTGHDVTVFYNSFPPSQINKWIEIYSHRFQDPVFRAFQAELEVVYEEKNMYSDMFQFSLIEKFLKEFFKNHPYGQQTLIGSIDDLKNPSLTKMYDFFKTYYVANNMALVLSGNFNSDEIIPIINEKFGALNKGELPKPIVYEELPFNGRELVEKNITPIKLGLLGYRTVPEGHADSPALEICHQILSNQNQTGLLDQLNLDNKLMMAQAMSLPFNDHSASIIFVIPKIIGQKLEEAESLVLAEIGNLKNGAFDDQLLESIKKQLYVSHQKDLESMEKMAFIIVDAFIRNKSLDDIFSYLETLNKIDKKEIVRVANKYYGNNYLAFFSKTGFPKKEKIEKPGFEPIVSNTEAKSVFTKRLDTIPNTKHEERFIEIDKDYQNLTFKNGNILYTNKNPYNDIFSLKIKFGKGALENPKLTYAAQLMNYAGTKDKDLKTVKNDFAKLGCNYSFGNDNSYTYVTLEGLEENLASALQLLQELLENPVASDDKIEILLDGTKAERKIEKTEPDIIADALISYLKYGDKCETLNRLTLKEIKALTSKELLSDFKNIQNFTSIVHFCGNTNNKDILGYLEKYIFTKDSYKKSNSPIYLQPKNYTKNSVYVVDKKNATQSKVFFYSLGEPYDFKSEPLIDAFNLYFGGGFSGLVLQEIREYRSLAYSAAARYAKPIVKSGNFEFKGYIGTQADKTNEAIETFLSLVREMPEKPERMSMITDYLTLSASSYYPNFRNLTEKVEGYRNLGFDNDPMKDKLKAYKRISFNQIADFETRVLKNRPITIAIVGSTKNMNIDAIKEYGDFNMIKTKTLFTK